MSTEDDFNRRLSLVETAFDKYGAYLRSYLSGLAGHYDGEELFDDLFLFALNRFPEDKINNLSALRRKAYQLFVDRWRKQRRNPVTAVEELPEIAIPAMTPEPFTEEEDAAFMKQFFSEFNVDLTEGQKTALWLHARHGYTFVECGKLMNIAPSTIGDWIKNAKIAFAEALNNT